MEKKSGNNQFEKQNKTGSLTWAHTPVISERQRLRTVSLRRHCLKT